VVLFVLSISSGAISDLLKKNDLRERNTGNAWAGLDIPPPPASSATGR
jgi:hypothetical protein